VSAAGAGEGVRHVAGRLPEIDLEAEASRIADWLRVSTARQLRKRGLVVAISGGIDSSVCAALAVRALGADKVFGLLLPEQDSSPRSTQLGRQLAGHLGIGFEQHDIAPALEALGCYRERDAAIGNVFPDYGPHWRSKIVISGGLDGGINFFKLVVHSPQGETREARLPLSDYLRIVAATNHKQRVRKTLEYYHADRLNYAVVGTPNRLEYDQGFFVKNGDGSADIKPIAHLFKTQVYAMARHLGLPAEICDTTPTTDTYSLPQGQDEFFFALPYAQMDLALWSHEKGCSAAQLAQDLGMDERQAQAVYADILAKRRAAEYLHLSPLRLLPGVDAVEGEPDQADAVCAGRI
jgi:NAD+ synthase